MKDTKCGVLRVLESRKPSNPRNVAERCHFRFTQEYGHIDRFVGVGRGEIDEPLGKNVGCLRPHVIVVSHTGHVVAARFHESVSHCAAVHSAGLDSKTFSYNSGAWLVAFA